MPSKATDQPGRPPDQSLHEEALGPWLSIEHRTNSDQTGQMHWLIFICFTVPQIIIYIQNVYVE